MDATQLALDYMASYEVYFEARKQESLTLDPENFPHVALAYAAIAQAFATERQAAALERIASALEHPNRLRAPDPQDYYSGDEYRQAADLHDYWTNSHPGENLDEYKQRIQVTP